MPGAHEGGMRREGGMPGPGGDKAGEAFMHAIVGSEAVARELGLTDEQVQSLRDQIHAGKIRMIDLRASLEKAAIEQARLLMETPVNEKELMKLVEKTGSIRTEMAKERIKHVVLLKNTLTPEQVEKARNIMRKHHGRMREGFDRGQGDRGRRGEGEGRRPDQGGMDREQAHERTHDRCGARRNAPAFQGTYARSPQAA